MKIIQFSLIMNSKFKTYFILNLFINLIKSCEQQIVVQFDWFDFIWKQIIFW